VIALLGFKLWRLLKELQTYRLGYRGEIFVSQILQPLTLMGYRVFHDIEMRDFKIDHVLVNSSGVFCLETEIQDNSKRMKKHQRLELNCDGKHLDYPWGRDSWSIPNVQRNASLFAKLLKEKTGMSIPVYPLLILPGWKIHRSAKGSVHVINPRELPAGLFYFPEFPLSDRQMDVIEKVIDNLEMDQKSNVHRASLY
jgi:hypothetical protein